MLAADVKEILYSVIEEIGRDKIRSEISANIDIASKHYSEEILKKCIKILDQESEETLGALCEALLHFMLTASLLPSERKTTLDGTELDIVVTSLKSLKRDPSKALVIQVVKDGKIDRISEAEKVQPNPDNLWVISAMPLDTIHRNYTLNDSFSSIISDIRAFLQDKGDNSLKMLHS